MITLVQYSVAEVVQALRQQFALPAEAEIIFIHSKEKQTLSDGRVMEVTDLVRVDVKMPGKK